MHIFIIQLSHFLIFLLPYASWGSLSKSEVWSSILGGRDRSSQSAMPSGLLCFRWKDIPERIRRGERGDFVPKHRPSFWFSCGIGGLCLLYESSVCGRLLKWGSKVPSLGFVFFVNCSICCFHWLRCNLKQHLPYHYHHTVFVCFFHDLLTFFFFCQINFNN